MARISAQLVKELRERTGLGMMECKKALAANEGDIDLAIEDLRKNSGLKAAKKADRAAAEGKVFVATNGNTIFAVEVNSETDFAAGDSNFLGFADKVVAKVAETKETDIATVMAGELESAREALVQKIGEKIEVRRIFTLESDVVGSYVHSNGKLAALVALKGGNEEVAKDIAMHIAAVNPQYIKQSDVPEDVIQKEKDIFTAQAAESGKPPEIIEKMIGGRINKFLAEISLLDQPFVKDPDVKIGALAKNAGAEVVSMVRFEVGEGIEKEEVDFAAEVAAQLKA